MGPSRVLKNVEQCAWPPTHEMARTSPPPCDDQKCLDIAQCPLHILQISIQSTKLSWTENPHPKGYYLPGQIRKLTQKRKTIKIFHKQKTRKKRKRKKKLHQCRYLQKQEYLNHHPRNTNTGNRHQERNQPNAIRIKFKNINVVEY